MCFNFGVLLFLCLFELFSCRCALCFGHFCDSLFGGIVFRFLSGTDLFSAHFLRLAVCFFCFGEHIFLCFRFLFLLFEKL